MACPWCFEPRETPLGEWRENLPRAESSRTRLRGRRHRLRVLRATSRRPGVPQQSRMDLSTPTSLSPDVDQRRLQNTSPTPEWAPRYADVLAPHDEVIEPQLSLRCWLSFTTNLARCVRRLDTAHGAAARRRLLRMAAISPKSPTEPATPASAVLPRSDGVDDSTELVA